MSKASRDVGRAAAGRRPGRAGATVAVVLGWLALLAVLAVAWWLALRACGVTLPLVGTLTWCEAAATPGDTGTGALRAELSRLEGRLNRAPDCPAPQPPEPEPAPDPEPPEPEPESEQEPEPQERAELPPCPVRETDRVIVLADVSGSMEWSIDLPATLERQQADVHDRIEKQPGSLGELLQRAQDMTRLADLNQRAQSYPGRSRLSVAKESLTQMVRQASPDVAFDFFTFAECGAPRYEGHYEPPQRASMISRVQGMRVRPNTALADAVDGVRQQLARAQLDDRINLVLVSDGQDSCGGDPCAAARRMSAQFPEVAINVVALSRNLGPIKCVAEATGGQFYTAVNAENLAESIRQAAGQNVPAHCRRNRGDD